MGLAKTWNGVDQFPYAHYKRDGICLEIMKRKSGLIMALTTTPHDIYRKIDHLPWLLKAQLLMPNGTSVFGELYVPGEPASHVSSAVANKSTALCFGAFAVNRGFDPNAPLWDTNGILADWGFETVPYMVRADADIPNRGEERFTSEQQLLEDPLPLHTEGFVLKRGNMIGWNKLKPVLTLDLRVKDVKPGKGKYEGIVGALIMETAEGHEIANISGMTDEQRKAMSINDRGRIAEVRYQYVGSQGRLRHPAFVRWRDDKTTANTIDADPKLEEIWSARNKTGDEGGV